MMKISILAAAALLLAGTSMAQAAWDQNQTILDLQAQGFTHIEVTVGVTQAKVEASNGTTKVETIYDLATGDVVKTESDSVDPNETQAPGVEINTSNKEAFVDGNDGEDNHGGASSGQGSDDEQADDNGANDDQADDNGDDSGDDNGDDNSGSGGGDDGGGDDSGDGGGDDHGGDSGHDGGDDD